MSASQANLYLKNGFDDKIINKFKPTANFRFIDDILCIVNDSNNIKEEFESFANSLIDIKIECNCNSNEVILFDVIFKRFYNILYTDSYIKDTSFNVLLHKAAYHPAHTFRGLAISRFKRLKRICSFKNLSDKACNILIYRSKWVIMLWFERNVKEC